MIHIKKTEIGLRFRRGEFVGLVAPGKHWIFDPLGRTKIKVVSGRDVYLRDDDLDVIVKSGALAGKADVYELTDMQRALVWIDGRFNAVLGPGLHALWTGYRRVRVEVIEVAATNPRFAHLELEAILAGGAAHPFLTVHEVPAEHAAVVTVSGVRTETLGPGRYAFWKNVGGLNHEQLQQIFTDWNKSELKSFLIELTSKVINFPDPDGTGKPLVEMIQDHVGMKGTGTWAIEAALSLQVPVPTIAAAVDAREISAFQAERAAALLRAFFDARR